MKKLIKILFLIIFLWFYIPNIKGGEILKLFDQNENWLVWKVRTDHCWVQVQQSYDLRNWKTVSIHGEKPPFHYVMVEKPEKFAFWRVIPFETSIQE